MDIGTQIKELRKALSLTQQELAEKLGLKRQTIASYEIGNIVPSDRTVWDICRVFNVNEHWLRTGEGEMLVRLSRSEELGRLVGVLLADKSESFRRDFITAFLRFDPNGPEWQVLENIYSAIKAEADARTAIDAKKPDVE